MKNYLFYFLAILFFVSCTQKNAENKSGRPASQTRLKSVSFKSDTISAVYDQYIKLKDALVNSDQATVAKESEKLSKSLQTIDGCGITAGVAEKISKSVDLKTQRQQFIILSSDLVALIKHADIASGSIFIDYCPMINSGKGGYWLASEKKIRNPYYGKQMISCGEVKQEIKIN